MGDIMQRLTKIGTVKPKSALEITHSRCGIGFEKLDRNVFDPEKAYDKIGKIGVKWIRLQSGWERTETEKGVYHFEWLDSIVDNLIERGLKPWICLCYGNKLYDEAAAKVFGAVGCPPIFTDEQKKAWENYVKATVKRYVGKVDYFEVWNEPDGIWCWKHGPNATELGHFTIDTAKYIREANPDAKVLGGSLCLRDMNYINKFLKTGVADHIDALTYHDYTPFEVYAFDRVKSIRGALNNFNPNVKIIQGETGSQSRYGGNGALKEGNWTPIKQAKQLARRCISDLMTEVEFFSYFTSVDMIEALNGTVGDVSTYLDYGYFGVLGADFDEQGRSTGEYTPKPSYKTLQTIAALFSEDTENCELPSLIRPRGYNEYAEDYDMPDARLIKTGFKKANGSFAYVYWYPAGLMTTTYEGTMTVQIAGVGGKDVKLVDILDGSVYELPEKMIEVDDEDGDCKTFVKIPVHDSPLALVFGDFIDGIEK